MPYVSCSICCLALGLKCNLEVFANRSRAHATADSQSAVRSQNAPSYATSCQKRTNDRPHTAPPCSQCVMPPPILNDSEDEEDDVVYDDSVDSRSRSSGESAPGIPALDGTRDTVNQSTGSTGEHRR